MSVIVNGMFAIKVLYNPGCVAALAAIDGRRYDANSKMWWFPIATLYEVSEAVRPYFPMVADRLEKSPRFQEVRDHIAMTRTTVDMSHAVSVTNFPVPHPPKIDYFGYQYAGIQFAYNLYMASERANGAGRNGCLIGDEMGCISGDAIVSMRKDGNTRRISLKKAYEAWRRNPSGFYIRGLKDGRFTPLPVHKILDKGIREVIKVTTESGKTLVCTPDHELLLSTGEWCEAKDTVGKAILVNGKLSCPKCGSTENIITYRHARFKGYCKACAYVLRSNRNDCEAHAYLHRDGYYYLRGRYFIDHPRYSTSGLLEHIFVTEQWLKRPIGCDEDVHHINGDQTDNRPENLAVISRSEHHKFHNKARNFGPSYTHRTGSEICMVPKEETVISVEHFGTQNVYDVVVSDDAHNFIADGFVVHNCGKSIQLLGLVNKVAEHKGSAPLTLLICPASLKNNWQREARTWLVSKPNILKVESGMPDFYIKRHNFVIINYDILEKYFSVLFSMDWDIIGLDEAHYIKSENAKRSQVCRILCHSEGKPKRPFVVELTGTPLVNRPKELWHLLHCIDPKQWANFTTFAKRYCLQFDKNHRANYNGAKNLAELQRILRTGYMIRRLKADVLKDLPPKRRQIIELGRAKYEKVLAEEQKVRASYDKMVAETDKLDKNLQQAIKNGDAANAARYRQKLSTIDGSTEGIGYGEIAKVRHATALAKVPECCKFISQLLEEKDKVVVFAHHRDVIEAIADNFKKESVVLYGGMGSAEKDNAVQKFLHNKRCRVFVVSITAGGVGLTLTAADTVVFCELDYSPSNNTQAEDRCFVAGTPVLTPKGYVPIERICVGDEVFGGDGKAHKVTDAWSHTTDKPLVTVRVWGNVPITCTADHKFMLRNGAWVEASKLKKGDALAYMPEAGNVDYTTPIEVPEEFKIPNPGTILSHEPNYRVRNNKVREVIPHEPVSTTVYDITVEDVHTFVVGNSVVHNCHRIGQKSCVFVYHLVVEGSIDAHIARKCVEKQHIIEQALDAKG